MGAHADPSRRRLPVVGSLPGAGYLNDRLTDALTLLSALPEIVIALRTIEAHITNLDAEVQLMRKGVEGLTAEVAEMRAGMQDLGTGINEVSASVGRLEPHVSDLSRLARPLRRRRRTDTDDRTHERRGIDAGAGLDPGPGVEAGPEDDPPLAGFA